MEYSINFEENIYPEDFNSRTEGIANWIEENRELEEWAKDPNAFEMTNVFLFAGKYISEGEDVNLDNVTRIWNLRKGDFERCGISKQNFVYQICEQSYDSAISGYPLVADEKSHSALRKMAGVGLYLMQQQRDTGEIDYDNFGECYQLIENAISLRARYPELHDRLKFDENIKRIYEMQMSHLDERSQKRLADVYDKYNVHEKHGENRKEHNDAEDR